MAIRYTDRRAGLSRLALSIVLLCGAAVLGSGMLNLSAHGADPERVVTENVLTQECSLTQRSTVAGRLGCALLPDQVDSGMTARFLTAPGG